MPRTSSARTQSNAPSLTFSMTQRLRHADAQQRRLRDWQRVCDYWEGSRVREEARERAVHAQERRKRLEERRRRLRDLLQEEETGLQREANEHVQSKAGGNGAVDDGIDLERMRGINLELRLREEERRRQQCELVAYHQWRERQPAIAEFQRRLHNRFVKEAWAVQCEERQMMEEDQRRQEEEARQMEAEEAQRAEEAALQAENERRKQAQHLKEQLRLQVEELRHKEAESQRLQLEEEEMLHRQAEVEALLERYSQLEEKRHKQELRDFLQHQYQLKLRRRAREVQEALAEDCQLLVELMVQVELDRSEQDERKVVARANMEEVHRQLEEQARQEKDREHSMAFLFNEEARKAWEMQEARWRLEEAARSKLLAEVLAAQQQQMAEKLEHNLEEQRALLRERSNLLAQVEAADDKLKESTAVEEHTRSLCQQLVENQVRTKHEERAAQLRQEQLEAEQRQVQLRLEEECIEKELKEMERQGYRPQCIGRRKILW